MWPEVAQSLLKHPDASKPHSLAQKEDFCANALPRRDSPRYSPSLPRDGYVVGGAEVVLLVLVEAALVAVTCFWATQVGFPVAVVAVDVVYILVVDVMVALVVDAVGRAALVVAVDVTCVLAVDVMVVLVVDAVGRAALVVPVVATCVLVADMLVALVLEFLDATILGHASLVALDTILNAATCQTTTPLVLPVAVAVDAKGGQSTSLSCVDSV